ncbi:hypothetical protein [Flaviaesturariibacter amylovorans]|uniref:Uncharacterized protein n=1 Tax=Flaviaesturariibacter amylovorans TaxID=1084520 RepID=A0ABP8HI21_9BACT
MSYRTPEPIVIPDSLCEGWFISQDFDFFDPNDKGCILQYVRKQIEYWKRGNTLRVHKISSLKHVLIQVEKANDISRRRRKYISEDLESPEYTLQDGNFVIVSDQNDSRRERYSGDMDDEDYIRSIENGSGEALGYGD